MENEGAIPPAEQDVPGVPKKKKGMLLPLIGALVIASLSSAAGATFGPAVKEKITGAKHAPAAGAEEGHEDKAEEGHGGHIAALDSLVVDVRDESGESHHVKVGIAVELAEAPHEEEFKVDVVPRARDATIGYLRSLKFEDAANADKFETIRTELQERLAKAVKKPKIKKVFFIDYVVQ